MKIKFTTTISKMMMLICFTFFSLTSYSQITGVSVFIEVKNMLQTSPYEFQYDVFATNTGLKTLKLRGYSYGINTTDGFANGGMIAHSYLSRDASLVGLFPFTPGYTNSQIRGTSVNSATSSVIMPIGLPIRLATCRIINTVLWPANYNPFLPPLSSNPASAGPIQIILSPGKTHCALQCIIDTGGIPGFSLIGFPNTPTSGQLNVLTAQMTPSPSGTTPFLLNTGGSLNIDNKNITNNTIALFPNPSNNELNIEIRNSQAKDILIKINNMNGELVKQLKLNVQVGVNTIPMNVSELAKGLYTVQVIENGKLTFADKFAKE